MRKLLILTTISMMAIACGDDDPAPPVTADDATTTAGDDDTGTTGGDDTNTTTGGDDTNTTTGDDDTGTTTGGDDNGTTTTGDDDTTLVVNHDGLLGSPCTSDDDCTGEYFCTFGFCTEFCRDVDNNFDPLPDTCLDHSQTSKLPAVGCPTDLAICMPGLANQAAVCETSAECPNGDFACGGIINVLGLLDSGACLPYGDKGVAGDSCTEASDCGSLFCLGANPDTGTSGACADHCNNNGDCGAGQLCQALPVPPNPDDPEAPPVPDTFLGLCVNQTGSLKYCFTQDTCPEDEVCNASIEPNGLGPQYHCITANSGAAGVGQACATGADCYSGNCLLGGIAGFEDAGFCSNSCQNDKKDCADDMNCAKLPLHDNGTVNPADNKLFGSCVFGQTDDFCLVDTFWCEDKLASCTQVEGEGVDGLGQCAAPPSGCAEGLPCKDGLTCTVDACDEQANECDFSALEANTCLIDGACYADGEANPANPCKVCASATASDAWSNAAAATPCDDGVLCNTAACDDAGACVGVEKDCDDAAECTTDSCNAETGACVNELAAGNCLIEGMCYADGADHADLQCLVCDASQPSAWTAAANDYACDDGVSCTASDTCQEGACTAGAADCDDSLACTTDACDTENDVCTNTLLAGNCLIGDACYGDGELSANLCNTCEAATATDAWTPVSDDTACDDGLACTDGDKCTGGSCGGASTCDDKLSCTVDECTVDGCTAGVDGPTCLIDGACYKQDDLSANNSCMACDWMTSQSAWTALGDAVSCNDGKDCTSGETCTGGSCGTGNNTCDDSKACTVDTCTDSGCDFAWDGQGCFIEGTCYVAGDAKSGDDCQVCAEGGTDWSNAADNISCGVGKICTGGVCVDD